MAKSEQGVILFVEPDLDNITWYADFRRQCLVELTNFLLLDCASTGASKVAGNTSMEPVQPVLGGFIETLGALRLAAKLRLRHLLKTILFLHLKLRQEALQKHKSTSVRSSFWDAEPIIGSRPFPKEATARLLQLQLSIYKHREVSSL